MKKEFQSKFKLLYGYDSNDSEGEDNNLDDKSKNTKRKDKKFMIMMEEFETL